MLWQDDSRKGILGIALDRGLMGNEDTRAAFG